MKLNISLDPEVVSTTRRRASATSKTVSAYLANLVREDDRRSQDELADEGYRLLSTDTHIFAAAALPLKPMRPVRPGENEAKNLNS